MSEEVWITVIATRFDTAFANRFHRERRTEPREPRPRPGRGAAAGALLATHRRTGA